MSATARGTGRQRRQEAPSAFGGSWARFVQLTLALARMEFKLRYFGSVLGYVWSLVRPLLFFGVLFLFFTKIVNLGKGVPFYGVYLLCSVVLWSYFSEATGGCVTCLVQREPMLRKMRFPRMVIPLSVSLTALFNLGMNFIAVIVFALLSGVRPSARWLEMLPLIGGFVLLATGIGMLLSALYVRFRDIAPIWEVVSQAWFYASPVMYIASAYSHLAPGVGRYALINPVAMLLTQMGHVFIDPVRLPGAATAAHGWWPVAAAVLLIVGIFALGARVFMREAPRVAENL